MNGLATRQLGIQRQQIVDRVTSALAENHFPALKTLEIDFKDGELKLRGSVRTYYEKQIACSLSQSVCGDTQIVDEISVNSLL